MSFLFRHYLLLIALVVAIVIAVIVLYQTERVVMDLLPIMVTVKKKCLQKESIWLSQATVPAVIPPEKVS